MAIFSRFVKPESVPQSDFPMEEVQYEIQVEVTKDKQVIKKLVESEDKVNIYEKIQADNHGLDVYDLIKRFSAGDPNVQINIVDWKDGDFYGTTMSLVEMQTVMNNAASEWEGLPLDVRQHYDHDLTKFLNAIDTGELKEYLANKDKQPESNKEDKSDE